LARLTIMKSFSLIYHANTPTTPPAVAPSVSSGSCRFTKTVALLADLSNFLTGLLDNKGSPVPTCCPPFGENKLAMFTRICTALTYKTNASRESTQSFQGKQITKKIRKHKAGLLLQRKKITTHTWRHKENRRKHTRYRDNSCQENQKFRRNKKTGKLGHEEGHGSRRPPKLLLWLLHDFCRWIPQSVCTKCA
jgi:hypothetical protein